MDGLEEVLLPGELDEPLEARLRERPLPKVRHQGTRVDCHDRSIGDDTAIGVHRDDRHPAEQHFGGDEPAIPAEAEDRGVPVNGIGRRRWGNGAGRADTADEAERREEERAGARETQSGTKHESLLVLFCAPGTMWAKGGPAGRVADLTTIRRRRFREPSGGAWRRRASTRPARQAGALAQPWSRSPAGGPGRIHRSCRSLPRSYDSCPARDAGTPTSHHAPASVQVVGWTRHTTTTGRPVRRAVSRARPYAAARSARVPSAGTSSTPQPIERACAAKSTRRSAAAPGPAASASMLLNPLGALPGLEPVDHREPGVVADNRHERDAGKRGRIEIGAEHQIRAVAEERRHEPVRMRCGAGHGRTPRPRQLVPHAREPVLEVHRRAGHRSGVRRRNRAPPTVELARDPARRSEDVVGRAAGVIDDPHDLGVRQRAIRRHAGTKSIDIGIPAGAFGTRLR